LAKTVTILGPFAQKDFNNSTARTVVETAISTAIGSNTCVSADPHLILGNIYIFVTTS
jgi:hypothetical protein|tara:strand:- start:1828 stop:2001 length:174 start_codon:yes stop_codon:yes gene_type:complete